MSESSGPIVITGKNRVRIVQMISQKHAMILEGKGLGHSSGRSVTAHVKKLYNLHGTRDSVIAQFTEIIKEETRKCLEAEKAAAVAPSAEEKA